jgi:hypothetical protein
MAIALILLLLLGACIFGPLFGVDSGAWDRNRRSTSPRQHS